ncbi:hypothetical protein BDN70DRAFT_901730 [Pholiota conissans]|uniref:Uncharacterized protein n=1 Tax=Pholiota conissans TaxID=109636 RepID=A0A9P6CLR1_9AGAR|nr:hypothetical protein BDN70DRAFT_901730 [Pholiota conissans]
MSLKQDLETQLSLLEVAVRSSIADGTFLSSNQVLLAAKAALDQRAVAISPDDQAWWTDRIRFIFTAFGFLAEVNDKTKTPERALKFLRKLVLRVDEMRASQPSGPAAPVHVSTTSHTVPTSEPSAFPPGPSLPPQINASGAGHGSGAHPKVSVPSKPPQQSIAITSPSIPSQLNQKSVAVVSPAPRTTAKSASSNGTESPAPPQTSNPPAKAGKSAKQPPSGTAKKSVGKKGSNGAAHEPDADVPATDATKAVNEGGKAGPSTTKGKKAQKPKAKHPSPPDITENPPAVDDSEADVEPPVTTAPKKKRAKKGKGKAPAKDEASSEEDAPKRKTSAGKKTKKAGKAEEGGETSSEEVQPAHLPVGTYPKPCLFCEQRDEGHLCTYNIHRGACIPCKIRKGTCSFAMSKDQMSHLFKQPKPRRKGSNANSGPRVDTHGDSNYVEISDDDAGTATGGPSVTLSDVTVTLGHIDGTLQSLGRRVNANIAAFEDVKNGLGHADQTIGSIDMRISNVERGIVHLDRSFARVERMLYALAEWQGMPGVGNNPSGAPTVPSAPLPAPPTQLPVANGGPSRDADPSPATENTASHPTPPQSTEGAPGALAGANVVPTSAAPDTASVSAPPKSPTPHPNDTLTPKEKIDGTPSAHPQIGSSVDPPTAPKPASAAPSPAGATPTSGDTSINDGEQPPSVKVTSPTPENSQAGTSAATSHLQPSDVGPRRSSRLSPAPKRKASDEDASTSKRAKI